MRLASPKLDTAHVSKDLITESITYYDSHNLKREAAEARSEIAYCYWREGRVNEARIMLLEALERLPPAELKRARALLKLVDVEHSAARHYDALKLLTENRTVSAGIKRPLVRLQDDDQLVRETAAKSLGKLQRHELLDALHSAARREKVAHVRKAIEAAIKSIESRRP